MGSDDNKMHGGAWFTYSCQLLNQQTTPTTLELTFKLMGQAIGGQVLQATCSARGLCCESWLAAIVQDEEQLVNVFDCRGLAERDSERLVIKKPQVDAVVLSLLVDDLGIAGLDLEAHSVEEGRVWDIHLQLLCACIGTKQA